jgi:hypothetical protein
VHGADVGPLTRNRQQRCSRAYAAKPPRKAAQRRSDRRVPPRGTFPSPLTDRR